MARRAGMTTTRGVTAATLPNRRSDLPIEDVDKGKYRRSKRGEEDRRLNTKRMARSQVVQQRPQQEMNDNEKAIGPGNSSGP